MKDNKYHLSGAFGILPFFFNFGSKFINVTSRIGGLMFFFGKTFVVERYNYIEYGDTLLFFKHENDFIGQLFFNLNWNFTFGYSEMEMKSSKNDFIDLNLKIRTFEKYAIKNKIMDKLDKKGIRRKSNNFYTTINFNEGSFYDCLKLSNKVNFNKYYLINKIKSLNYEELSEISEKLDLKLKIYKNNKVFFDNGNDIEIVIDDNIANLITDKGKINIYKEIENSNETYIF